MITVNFHNQSEISDELLKFAVIAARLGGKWIFCRHKERDTWEIPGGHREKATGGGYGEDVFETAKRELREETGAVEFEIKSISVYGVTKNEQTTYGMLFFADVKTLGELPPEMEIGEIMLSDTLPKELTYPEIQPYLLKRVQSWLNLQSSADEFGMDYER
ncbi:MAG: DNA mismatch repair protein MutT [Clostridiales bacterium GWF2_38_85]|nr:MAG: DNA mismatch repair protein MutT [Clostridiales bacterium GWF2_38_85]HBL84395.1 DNA mismatch repair protein MutT [Clostridiales bacterium]